MRYLKFILLIIVILSLSKGKQCLAQNFSPDEQHQIDSLNKVITNPKSHDTSIVSAYVWLSEALYVSNLDTLIPLCEKAKSIAETAKLTQPSTPILRSLNTSLAGALNNIGYVYDTQGNIPKALEYYHKSYKIQEELGNKEGIAGSLNNIGLIHLSQGENLKALEFSHRSLKIYEKLGIKSKIANSLVTIGFVYLAHEDTLKALDYYHKGLKIFEEIESKLGVSSSFNNIGFIHHVQGNIPKALEYYYKSLEIREEIGAKEGIANSLSNIGKLETDQGALVLAEIHLQRSLKLAYELGSPARIAETSLNLSDLAKKQGKHELALQMFKQHIQMRDSINNEETQKATIRQQTQYEFEKTQIVKENQAKERVRLLVEATSRRNNLQYSLIFLGILLLFVLILMLGFIKVSTNVAEGLIFFAFLILFEFVLVFAEPYLEQYTNDEPMYNLLANSVLALLIFPVHSILERLLKKRIVK